MLNNSLKRRPEFLPSADGLSCRHVPLLQASASIRTDLARQSSADAPVRRQRPATSVSPGRSASSPVLRRRAICLRMRPSALRTLDVVPALYRIVTRGSDQRGGGGGSHFFDRRPDIDRPLLVHFVPLFLFRRVDLRDRFGRFVSDSPVAWERFRMVMLTRPDFRRDPVVILEGFTESGPDQVMDTFDTLSRCHGFVLTASAISFTTSRICAGIRFAWTIWDAAQASANTSFVFVLA